MHTFDGLLLVSSLKNNSDEEDTYEVVNVGELPNSSVVSHCNELLVRAHKDVKRSKLRVLHERMHKLLALPTLAFARGFSVILSKTY